uniref:Protein S100-A13 n=1 Tax=Equus caballus TaxID=9796 RepID=A0A9L0T3A4_HORSE
MAAEPLTELEAAIETVVTTFFTFAGREGRKGSLSVNEFKELATQQLPHLLKDVGSLDEKMKSLDVNQDSELKFHEYWRLIGELAKEIRKEKAQEIRKKATVGWKRKLPTWAAVTTLNWSLGVSGNSLEKRPRV